MVRKIWKRRGRSRKRKPIAMITMITIITGMITMDMIMAKRRANRVTPALECRLSSFTLLVQFDLHSRYDHECWSCG